MQGLRWLCLCFAACPVVSPGHDGETVHPLVCDTSIAAPTLSPASDLIEFSHSFLHGGRCINIPAISLFRTGVLAKQRRLASLSSFSLRSDG